MNAETFCEHFATFADASNGVAKLRELILQLAVQGKLGTQDVNDEPVDMLMQTIDRERSTHHTVNPTASSRVPDANVPHTLPATWCWLPLTSVFIPISAGDKKLKSTEYQKAGRIPIIDQGQRFVAGYTDDEEKLTRLPGPVVVFGDHTRELKFVDFDFAQGADGIKILRPIGIDPRYFYLVLHSYSLDDRGYGRHYKILLSQLFPLPPLAEQRRIVEKVDQLLALCDELAARQAAQRQKRQRLIGATLDRLVSTRNPAEFPTNAHRLRNHFDQLFDTTTTIPQLRQTILQLAVQGKLVPQEPNEDPASQLLEKIKSERAQLVAQKKISRSELTAPVDESQMLFSIPDAWCWVRLHDVCHVITDGEHLTPKYADAGVPMLSAKHVGSKSLVLDDFKLVSDATAAKCWSRCFPEERDILVVSRGGGVGRTIISGRRDYCLMGSVLLFKLASQVDERFLCHFLNSTQGNQKLRTTSGASAQQAIYIAHLKRDYVVPLPPLAEQKRIVTKVTELLSLCDALEAKLTQAESASTQLLSAAVHHLLHNSPS